MSAEEHLVNLSEEDLATVHEFWDDIILNADGTVSMANVYAELFDFLHMINEVPKVYSAVTCDQMSKPNYFARDVIAVAAECQDDAIANAVRDVLDDIEDGVDINDIRAEYPDPYTGRVEREQRQRLVP